MADHTGIEWTDATWNPVRGCSRVSEGCRHCYAETVAARFSDQGQPFHGFAERGRPGSKWTGRVELVPHALDLPLRWRKPRRIFVNSMSDLFHEDLPDADIDQVFAVMALAQQHTLQVLTKRAPRMRAYISQDRMGFVEGRAKRMLRERSANPGNPVLVGRTLAGSWPWPHVHLGVSVENQAAADARIPELQATPAALRFLSCEPLLGPLRLDLTGIGWVVAGGESGRDARPMHPDWARGLRDQCQAAGVPFFFKQWGEWRPPAASEMFNTLHGRAGTPPAFIMEANGNVHCTGFMAGMNSPTAVIRVGKKKAGALLDGHAWREVPA